MIAVEASKQVWRVRTYVGMGLVAVIPIILAAALKAHPSQAGVPNFTNLAASSGINLSIESLTAVSAFLLVVVVSLFAGETVAGEADWGTLRYLLVRPVGRGRLLAAKLSVAVALSVVATFVVPVVGLVVGTLAFGWHSVQTPTMVSLSAAGAIGRLAIGALFVAWSQGAYIALAFMLSTMTNKPIGAVAGGVGLGVVSQILNNIAPLNGISYLFPTHYLNAWQALFFQTNQGSVLLRGVILQVPYVVVFLGIAWWWFSRKDILS